MRDRVGRMGLLLALLLLPLSQAAALVTNEGGIFILHVPTEQAWEPGSLDGCTEAPLEGPAQARVKMAGDGVPRLVVLYAAFPPDSTAEVAGHCFGLRYSANVKIWSFGACNNGGMDLPNAGWPSSGGGTSVLNQPFKLARGGRPITLYWFALSARGPGYFEVTPNPLPNLGGKVGNTDPSAYLAAIADYGKVGFDLDGYAPEIGSPARIGACCLDECIAMAETECAFYKGIYLGDQATCDNDPCGPTPIKGGCCLSSGCEMLSLIDCARERGFSLGEGVACGVTPCPPAGSLLPGNPPGIPQDPDTSGTAPQGRGSPDKGSTPAPAKEPK